MTAPAVLVVVPDEAPAGDELAGHLRATEELLALVLDELGDVWRAVDGEDGNAAGLTDDVDLPALVRTVVLEGGKRVRPSMCFAGWLAAGGRRRAGDRQDVLTASAALELLHAFALIHDDVMDESELRRGRPTVHATATAHHVHHDHRGDPQRFGESMAVLAGDLLHAEAGHLAGRLPEPMRRIWRALVAELVAGQRRDLLGVAAGRRDLPYARTVARMKSGKYTVQRPVELGAAAAAATPAVTEALQRYGRHAGEAFALRDDVLGIWGDPARTGKPAGDDILSGKPTVVLALAEQQVRQPAARAALARAGRSGFTAAEAELLSEQLRVEGIKDAVEDLIGEHVRAALGALSEAQLEPVGAAHLADLVDRLAWRDR